MYSNTHIYISLTLFSLIIVSYNFQSVVSNKYSQQSFYIFSTFVTFPVFFISRPSSLSPSFPCSPVGLVLKVSCMLERSRKRLKIDKNKKKIGKSGSKLGGLMKKGGKE